MQRAFRPILLFAVCALAPLAHAQDETLKLDLYAGFDYVRFNINAKVSGFPPSATFNGYGGGGQLAYNANHWLGLVGDLGGYYFPDGTTHGGAFSCLFGPRINLSRGNITPFAQALFGGLLTSDGIGHLGPQNQFAMTAGGGADFKVSPHIAIRPVQAEYFLTKIPDGLNNRQNNFRFRAGIVFPFGG